MAEQTTIVDVARRAGLSIATVSRVVHNSPRVSDRARQRVQEAIDALGYMPNGLARGLVMSATRTVGVLVASIADPVWGEVVRGIEDYAQDERYSVIIASSYEDSRRESNALNHFQLKRVDGVIVGGSSGGPNAVQETAAARLPYVFVNNEHVESGESGETWESGDRSAASGEIRFVANDDVHDAIVATTYLLELGHRRIAYIGATGRASSLRRLHGFRLAHEQAGVVPDDRLIVAGGESPHDGELAAFRLLAGGPTPTALFCYGDITALGALRAIRALGLRVPQDISVIGFDDIPIAEYLEPPLTTMRQPLHRMGQHAMSTLVAMLRGESAPLTVTMPGELVVRASSGPAPASS